MRECLDEVIEAKKCSIRRRHKHSRQRCKTTYQNLKSSISMRTKGRLETNYAQMLFWAKEIDFLCRTITPEGVKPQQPRV